MCFSDPFPEKMSMKFEAQRRQMIRDIAAHARQTSGYTGIEEISPEVIRALEEVERHRFLPATFSDSAYGDHPLPIGSGQTISQPFIVALMAQVLSLTKNSVVLEAGAGCGYHAAILSKLSRFVYAVEIIEELAQTARNNLKPFKNIEVACRNGFYGWSEKAPFDAISVAAAAPEIPPDLIDQLKPGGRMILPLGRPGHTQNLTLVEKTGVEKTGQSRIKQRPILPVVFVPFVKTAG